MHSFLNFHILNQFWFKRRISEDAIEELDDISKQLLYDNLAKLGGKVFNSTGIPVERAITIIAEGLEAKVCGKFKRENINGEGSNFILWNEFI